MLLWPFNKYPGTDYETFNWEWILKTVKEYTAKVDDFIEDMTDAWDTFRNDINDTWNTFRNWVSHEIADMHRDFAIYVNATEGALNTGAIADGAVTAPKLNSTFLGTLENSYVRPEQYGAVGDGVSNDTSAFLQAFATGKEVRLTGGKTYLLDPIEFTENDNDLVVKGSNAVLKFNSSSNSDTFITFNRCRYIYFYDCHFEGNNYTGTCITATVNTYDWHFINCDFTNFNNAIYGAATFWGGYFFQCYFRNNNIHYKHETNGASFIVFEECIFEGIRDYVTYFTTACQAIFTKCIIEGRVPTSGVIHYDTSENGKIIFENSYHEITDGDVITVYAPNGSEYIFKNECNFRNAYINAKKFNFFENLRDYGFNKIDYVSGYNTPVNRIRSGTQLDTQQLLAFYGFDWIKNNIDPKIAQLDVTDTLPAVTIGNATRYGNEYFYSSSQDMTSPNTDKIFQLGVNNKALTGHTIVCEYEFSGDTTATETLGLILTHGTTYRSNGTNINPMRYTKDSIKNAIGSNYKLAIRQKVTGDDITAIRLNVLRNNTNYKLTALYII